MNNPNVDGRNPHETKAPISTFETSGELFYRERFLPAFPNIKDVEEIFDPALAIKRLELVLKTPLIFEDMPDPIWCYGGRINMQIALFKKLKDNVVLMNNIEFAVKRIIAFNTEDEFSSFVYVESDSMPPTGIQECEWTDEAYGITPEGKILGCKEAANGRYVNKDGNVVDVVTEYRCRKLQPYNFMIISKDAIPVKENRFNERFVAMFDRILKGDADADVLFESMKKFK